MTGREALNHRLELLVEDREVFRMRLDSLISLFQKLRSTTSRRHIQKQKLASTIAVDLLCQRSIPRNQLGGEFLRVRV